MPSHLSSTVSVWHNMHEKIYNLASCCRCFCNINSFVANHFPVQEMSQLPLLVILYSPHILHRYGKWWYKTSSWSGDTDPQFKRCSPIASKSDIASVASPVVQPMAVCSDCTFCNKIKILHTVFVYFPTVHGSQVTLGSQNSPATMRVWVAVCVPVAVKPLHSTTVPLSSALAVNLKVDVRSVSSASVSRFESDTFLLTMSRRSGGNLASRTGERRAP